MEPGDQEHFVVSGDIVAPEEFQHDWTDALDRGVWQFLTAKRYEIMKEAFLSGTSVQFKGSGSSLSPFVCSGDICFLQPIVPGCSSQVLPGDIVFCAVQPNDRYYVHLVWTVYVWETDFRVKRTVYVIGNNKEGETKAMQWLVLPRAPLRDVGKDTARTV